MATYKYLDSTGLGQVWEKIKTLVSNSIPTPDWDESDSTSANYIANRTHWKEEETATLIPEQTVNVEYFNGEGIYYTSGSVNEEYATQLEEGTEICVNCQGNNYTTEITYSDGYYSSCNAIDCTDYMIGLEFEPDSFYINFYYSGEQYNVPSTITISAIVIQSTFHKLDSRYLNGTLIQSGTGKDSEIFNGINAYKMASGDCSHVEGWADSYGRELQINLTGDAGATEYSCIIYSYKDEYESIIDNGFCSLIDSHDSTVNQKISGINMSSSLDNPREGTINFDETLSQDVALSNQPFHLLLPKTIAGNVGSHAEGRNTIAMGSASHSEGSDTVANGSSSHAEGYNTTATRCSQHVFGEYNILDATGSSSVDKGAYVEIVGNGTAENARSNARTLDWNGNEVLAGKLTVGTAPTNNMDVATKQYVDTATASITDEKLSTGTIGNNVYYPIVGDNTASATTKYIDSTGLKYDATSSTNGYARLYLGNGTASGTEGSKYGRLMIYGTTAYAVTLDSGSPTENRSISLPNKNGTVALTSDVPTKTSDLTNDSGFLTSHQSLSNCVALSGAQTISGVKTFDMEVKFNGGGGASDISTNVQCAFKVNRGQITNFFTQNIYTKTNNITFYKYSDIVNSAPSSPTALFTIKNGGTVSIGTTSSIPSITENNELTTKKYVDDAISGAGTGAGTLSISANVITLTGSDGTTSSITLPIYNGGVSS